MKKELSDDGILQERNRALLKPALLAVYEIADAGYSWSDECKNHSMEMPDEQGTESTYDTLQAPYAQVAENLIG